MFEVWISECMSDVVFVEIVCNFGLIVVYCVLVDEFVQVINQVYVCQDGSVVQVVGEVEGEVDLLWLMQDIFEVEDLFELEDDVLIIWMINVLFM